MEAHSGSYGEYGWQRVEKTLLSAPSGSAEAALKYILDDFHSFVKDRNLPDDLTIMVLKRL
ncbi:MAG: hypothetical protein GY754_41335 [bacterium]|nr:hypothetical protein [bacterium]